MFARLAIIAAAIALASAAKSGSVARRNDDYAPAPTNDYTPSYENDYQPEPEYKPAYKPAYKPTYKDDKYDKAYDYAFEHYAHEAKEDRRGLGYGESWEDNFERRHEAEADYEPEYKPEYEAEPEYEPEYQPEYEPEYEPEYPEYEPEYEEYEKRHEEPSKCDDYSCYKKEFVPRNVPVSSCNTGDLQCCNQVQSANTVDFEQFKGSSVFELIPNALRGSNTPVGLSCSPIVQDTSGGVQCNQQSVCCDGGHFSGLFSVNCNAFNGGSQSAGIF